MQQSISSYGKMRGSRLDIKRRSIGGNTGSATASSFFRSFLLFLLAAVVGWWLYVISFLPSIFGVGVSTALINYSQQLAYIGIAVIFAFDTLAVYRLLKDMKSKKLV